MNDTEKLSDGAYRLHRFDDVPVRYDELQPWALDLVPERKEIADSLTALFRGSEHPFVVAVNAGWGTGKSLFLRMWSDDLINRGYACLTFNAWEYDHTDQPLTAFLTALRRQKEDRWSREPTFTTRMANRIADVCGNFFNTFQRLHYFFTPFENKRDSNYAYRQYTHFFRDACNNRSSPCSRSSSHTGSNENHLRTVR